MYSNGGLYAVIRALFKISDDMTAFVVASLVNDTTHPITTVTTYSDGMDNKTSALYEVGGAVRES